jgi:hypothetical protein
MNIALPIGFLILATILLWFLIYTKGKWGIKVALIMLGGFYSLVVFDSLGTYAGWATSETLPDEFRVHWIVINEPNKKTGDKGNIYVWIGGAKASLSVFGYKSAQAEPRSYSLPYSLEMHKKAAGALALLRKGKAVFGKKGKGKGGFGGEEDDGKEGDPRNKGPRNFSRGQEFEFHELLPTIMPDKNR